MAFTLCLITPDWNFPNEHAIVNQCLSLGLHKLHLRKPDFGYEENRQYLEAIDERFHSRVILHNSFELIKEYRLGGCHLNSAMRRDEALMEKVKSLAPSSLSASFHSWEEILAEGQGFSYAFISPVFDSISKQGYKAAIDLKEAALLKEKMAALGKQCPALIGLGGVEAANISLLKDHGFDGAALLGSVWKTTDPVLSFKEMLKIC